MPVCEGCGASFANTFQFCPHCGREKQVIQDQKVISLSGRECPLCNKDDHVTKITTIIQRETQRISGQLPVTSTQMDSDGHLRTSTDLSHFSGTSISDLAQKLKPPSKPSLGCLSKWRYPDTTCLTIGSAIMALALFGFGFSMMIEGDAAAIAGLIGGIAFIGIFLGSRKFKQWQSKKGEEALKPEMDRWNYAMSRWDKLYYCSRDDCLYIPGEHVSVPIESMEKILYWNYEENTIH